MINHRLSPTEMTSGLSSAVVASSPSGMGEQMSSDAQSISDCINALFSDLDSVTATLNESLELVYELWGMTSVDTEFIECREKLVEEISASWPAYIQLLSLVTSITKVTEYCKEYSKLPDIPADRVVSSCR